MGEWRDELAQWRRPYETAAAGEARDVQGESTWGRASNGMGRQGTGRTERAARAGRVELSVRTYRHPLRSITVKDNAW
jgi:hypothetical protein